MQACTAAAARATGRWLLPPSGKGSSQSTAGLPVMFGELSVGWQSIIYTRHASLTYELQGEQIQTWLQPSPPPRCVVQSITAATAVAKCWDWFLRLRQRQPASNQGVIPTHNLKLTLGLGLGLRKRAHADTPGGCSGWAAEAACDVQQAPLHSCGLSSSLSTLHF